jgi:hypothetical protein
MIAFTAIAMGMRNAAVRFGANFRLADLYRQVVRVKKMQRSTLRGMTTNKRISTETGKLSRSDGAGIRLEFVKVLCQKYVKNTFILLLPTRWFLSKRSKSPFNIQTFPLEIYEDVSVF